MNAIGDLLITECPFDVDDYWYADGRTVLIAEYPALFGVYGTRFGGDGITTFKIPLVDPISDLQHFVVKYQ